MKVMLVGIFSDVLCCNNRTKWYHGIAIQVLDRASAIAV